MYKEIFYFVLAVSFWSLIILIIKHFWWQKSCNTFIFKLHEK